MDYPKSEYATGGAGFKAYGTSQEAASLVHVSVNEAEVLGAMIALGGLATATEIKRYLGWEITSVRPRLTGLVGKIQIRKTEQKKKLPNGCSENFFEVLATAQ